MTIWWYWVEVRRTFVSRRFSIARPNEHRWFVTIREDNCATKGLIARSSSRKKV